MPLPYSFIEAENAGAGTANAIVATSDIPITDGPLVILPIVATTTGSATVSFNGAAPVTIKTVTGNDLPANALVAGMRVMGIRSATDFRLVTEIVSAAIIAQAQAAADLALARAQHATEMAAFFDPDSFALVGELAAAIAAAKSAANIETGTLADARLSARLQTGGLTISDFNDVAVAGWYYIASAGNNLPVAATAFVAEAVAKDANNIIVTAYSFGVDPASCWQRQKVAGTWGAWRRVYGSAAEIKSLIGSRGKSSIVTLSPSTAVDFTGIPAGVQRVQLFIDRLLASSSNLLVRLGTSGGIVSTGYDGRAGHSGGYTTNTTGFINNTDLATGNLICNLEFNRLSGNKWLLGGQSWQSNGFVGAMGGYIDLPAELTQLRLTTLSGTAAFAAGSAMIMWEF